MAIDVYIWNEGEWNDFPQEEVGLLDIYTSLISYFNLNSKGTPMKKTFTELPI